MVELTGMSIAITGAAGGLGAAQARRFRAAGARLHLLDRPGPALADLGDELGAATHAVDVASEADMRAAFDAIRDDRGLDALVVTAGVQLHDEDGPAAGVTLDAWNRTIAVNLTGAFLACREALPLLTDRPTSSIVLIGSPTGMTMSGAGYTAYSASKAGMMSLARVIAADYASQGVRANVIVPGTMITPLTAALLSDETTRTDLLAGTPAGRLGVPEDLTGLAAWLVSDESRFATGAFFAVDGGLTAR